MTSVTAPELPARFLDPFNDLYENQKRLQYVVSNGSALPPLRATREMAEGFVRIAAAEISWPEDQSDLALIINGAANWPGMTLADARALHL